MATANESNLCSTCNKTSARRFCIGCKNYFCPKHMKEHEQQLSIQFDDEVVRSHDEILDKIQKLQQLDDSSSALYDKIEQWKKQTIQKVEVAAENARAKINDFIKGRRMTIVKELDLITMEIRSRREEENFVEDDINRLRSQIDYIRHDVEQLVAKDTPNIVVTMNNQIDWNRIIVIQDDVSKKTCMDNRFLQPIRKWKQNGIIVAGGNGKGSGVHQLNGSYNMCIDDNGSIFVSEYLNHRIVEWKLGATSGQIVAGGNGAGNRLDQLKYPAGFLVDNTTDSLIICDYCNHRLVRWPRHGGQAGEILYNIGCWSVAMDNDGFLYVSDFLGHAVRRYRMGESQGIVVAGGQGSGNRMDQLNHPRDLFVDLNRSVYISDSDNHRIVRWDPGAKEGILVAGGHDAGNSLNQLRSPYGIVFDECDAIYITDNGNQRVLRWTCEAEHGTVIVGGNGTGSAPNQLANPCGLAFDQDGSLYVCDAGNQRIVKFEIDQN